MPYFLVLAGVEHDVSALVRTYHITDRACNEELRHAVNTRAVTFRYTASLFSLLASEGALAVVDLDGARDFTGRVAPSSIRVQSYGASAGPAPDVDDIQVELEDFTYKLDREIQGSDGLVLENAYVCNPAQPAQSVVHRLLALTTVTFDISVSILTVLQGFAADSGTVAETLDTLLYEYGYTYRFNAYGQLVLQQYLFDSPTPSVVLTETDLHAPFEVEKLAKEADAVEVAYYPLKSRANALLYMADLPFGENGLRSGWPIQPGLLWPEEANVQETWFTYDDKGLANRVNERGEVVTNADYTSLVLTKNHAIEEPIGFDRLAGATALSWITRSPQGPSSGSLIPTRASMPLPSWWSAPWTRRPASTSTAR